MTDGRPRPPGTNGRGRPEKTMEDRTSFIAHQHPYTASLFGLGYPVGSIVRIGDHAAKVTGNRFIRFDEEVVGMYEVSADYLAGVDAEQAARALRFDEHFIGLLPVSAALMPMGRPLASKTGVTGATCAVHRDRRDLIFTRLLPHETVPVLRMKRERATAGLLAGARAWNATNITV